VHRQLLEIDAPRKMSYTWTVGGARYGWKAMGGKLFDLLAKIG
jgi:hypothetical protein